MSADTGARQRGFDPAIRTQAESAQRTASDPRLCVFVEANAGSGKTRVLVDRVARLLLAGASPERILCVTYTKAAAGEMQTRLFKKLGDWSAAPDDRLTEALKDLLGGLGPSPDELAEARRLFARALETPGGLKIQTLHAYSESLLRRFPLEAGLAPGFITLDEAESAALYAQAVNTVLAKAAAEPEGPIAGAIETLLETAGPTALETLRAFTGQERQALTAALAEAGSTAGLMDEASIALGVPPDLRVSRAKTEAWRETNRFELEAAIEAYEESPAKSDIERAEALQRALDLGAVDPEAAFDAYTEFFLTGEGQPRKALYTKSLGERQPLLVTLFGPDGAERHRMCDEALPKVRAAFANAVSRAAIRLAAAILAAYETRLSARRAVDFSDLIARAKALLTDGEAKAWIGYKLDQGLDHILLDEAQDTSPDQWATLTALSEEFFAGAGARETPDPRTVFCVGDEKQSIYSFQKAEPARFIEERSALEERANAAKIPFRAPGLDVSFRSAPEILAAVDQAFAAEHTALSAVPSAMERKFLKPDPAADAAAAARPFHAYAGHKAARTGTPGCVEVWPPIPQPPPIDEDALDLGPVDRARPDSARNQLAAAVAGEIAALLERGDRVWEEAESWRARPAEPRDVYVLVRKRGPLFEEIIRRLKLNDVPVAGADRMVLAEQLAVKDLLSLARFALSPEDDLALAEALKSPVFHPAGAAPVFDDDVLFDLAYRRAGSLWTALQKRSDPRFAEAKAALSAARARAEAASPYAFFADFLFEASWTGESRLARLLARLGEEARDPLEAFLSKALAQERAGAPSLSRFIAEIDRDEAEIKREIEAGENAVRVMTVHGAKGLEAPIFFLPDTTQIPKPSDGGLYLHPKAGLLASPGKGPQARPVEDLKALAAAKARAENDRLFYVAATRARDRLVVCGHKHGKAPGRIDAGSWMDRALKAWTGPGWADIAHPAALPQTAVLEVKGAETPPARRFGPAPPALQPAAHARGTAPALPDWARTRAPQPPDAPGVLAPSRLGVREDDAPSVRLSPLDGAAGGRLQRGALIHKLLETLPDIDPERRAEAAARFLAHHPSLSEEAREEIAAETLAVLDHPDFAPLFGPGSLGEAAVAGTGPGLPAGAAVVGRIARLVIQDHEILILDYKTMRPAPRALEEVAPADLAQMAAYRAALMGAYPGRAVRAALLFTDGPRLLALPESALEAALAALTGPPLAPR